MSSICTISEPRESLSNSTRFLNLRSLTRSIFLFLCLSSRLCLTLLPSPPPSLTYSLLASAFTTGLSFLRSRLYIPESL